MHAYGEIELAEAGARAAVEPRGAPCGTVRGPALLYMVMPYVGGGTLAERLAGGTRLPAAEVRWLLAELAGALEYAHREGVVHRDVKPENVLLAADGTGGPARPVLIDFGVAALLAGTNARGSLLGAVRAMGGGVYARLAAVAERVGARLATWMGRGAAPRAWDTLR